MTPDDLTRVERFFVLPDGRYPCDWCEAATELEHLTRTEAGVVCPDCNDN